VAGSACSRHGHCIASVELAFCSVPFSGLLIDLIDRKLFGYFAAGGEAVERESGNHRCLEE
jgi:hypothetical protein